VIADEPTDRLDVSTARHPRPAGELGGQGQAIDHADHPRSRRRRPDRHRVPSCNAGRGRGGPRVARDVSPIPPILYPRAGAFDSRPTAPSAGADPRRRALAVNVAGLPLCRPLPVGEDRCRTRKPGDDGDRPDHLRRPARREDGRAAPVCESTTSRSISRWRDGGLWSWLRRLKRRPPIASCVPSTGLVPVDAGETLGLVANRAAASPRWRARWCGGAAERRRIHVRWCRAHGSQRTEASKQGPFPTCRWCSRTRPPRSNPRCRSAHGRGSRSACHTGLDAPEPRAPRRCWRSRHRHRARRSVSARAVGRTGQRVKHCARLRHPNRGDRARRAHLGTRRVASRPRGFLCSRSAPSGTASPTLALARSCIGAVPRFARGGDGDVSRRHRRGSGCRTSCSTGRPIPTLATCSARRAEPDPGGEEDPLSISGETQPETTFPAAAFASAVRS